MFNLGSSQPCRALGLLAASLWASGIELQLAGAVTDVPRKHEADSSDVLGFVQLQLQAHSGEGDQASTEGQAAKPGTADLCFVRDNRCFDGQLKGEPDDIGVAGISAAGFTEIVVTRKGEDVRWLDALPELPAVVYDRGGSPSLLPKARSNLHIVSQANTGREDDEMLRHITTNYDRLPNVTVFLQGWPLLHCAGIVSTLRHTLRFLLDPDAAVRLGNGAMQGLAPLSRTFYEYYEPEGLVGYTRAMAEAHEVDKDALERALVLYATTCRSILGRPCPERHWVAEGAQWAVSRERLHSQPLEVYQRVLELGEGYQGKLRGLVLEAVWPILWGAGDWDPRSRAVTALAAAPAGTEPETREEWCERWWWTWVCDQAALPAGQHRRRSKRSKGAYGAYAIHGAYGSYDTFSAYGAYGSFSKSLVQSTNGHCASPDGNDALLWSCEDRMAFCELQRWQSHDDAGSPHEGESQQFLLQRPRFHVHDHLSSSGHLGSNFLEMLVRIRAPLIAGAPSFVAVNATDNGLWLLPQSTQWYLASVPSASPKQGSDAVFASTSFTISTTDTHGPTLFLACNKVTGEATLSLSKEPWEFAAAPDGFVHLRSSSGGLLQSGAGPSKRLFCESEGDFNAVVFSLELEEHALPEELEADTDSG